MLLLVLAGRPAARAGESALVLPGEDQVHGDSIYLADLLPAQFPAAMRQAAQKIRVAAAPLPGGTVVLSGETIAALLQGTGASAGIPGGVTVPPQIVVRAAGRRISRDEVVAAIFAALRANGVPEAAGLLPEDVHFTAPVTVSSADAQLQVRRIDFDPALRQARFLLASAADKRALPFIVTAALHDRSATSASEPPEAAPAAGVGAPSARNIAGSWPGAALNRMAVAGSLPPVAVDTVLLVEPKKPASLHVISGTMQMFLDVLPLDRGVLNDTVRVRVPGTGRILLGRVVAAGRLEAQF